MTTGNGLDMYVFREGRREQSGPRLVDELIMALRSRPDLVDPDQERRTLVTALLGSGELECALTDVGHDDARLMARANLAVEINPGTGAYGLVAFIRHQ